MMNKPEPIAADTGGYDLAEFYKAAKGIGFYSADKWVNGTPELCNGLEHPDQYMVLRCESIGHAYTASLLAIDSGKFTEYQILSSAQALAVKKCEWETSMKNIPQEKVIWQQQR